MNIRVFALEDRLYLIVFWWLNVVLLLVYGRGRK
jgi:hypothetical protein